MNDEQKALNAADDLMVEHGMALASDRLRTVLALAYLTGSFDGMTDAAALADAALARLADDLAAVKP